MKKWRRNERRKSLDKISNLENRIRILNKTTITTIHNGEDNENA
jgi:hypothetical protein